MPMLSRDLLFLFHGTIELSGENYTQYTEGRVRTGAMSKPVGTSATKRSCLLCMLRMDRMKEGENEKRKTGLWGEYSQKDVHSRILQNVSSYPLKLHCTKSQKNITLIFKSNTEFIIYIHYMPVSKFLQNTVEIFCQSLKFAADLTTQTNVTSS
jgi:hypothetical protein